MKNFMCDNCENTVLFENTQCLKCGLSLAFRPEALVMTGMGMPPQSDVSQSLRSREQSTLDENLTGKEATYLFPAALAFALANAAERRERTFDV